MKMSDPAFWTAIGLIITGVSGIIGLLTKLVLAARTLVAELKKNTRTTNNTNTLVNNTHDENTNRLDQLTQSIVDLGGKVPADPAVVAAQRRMARHAADQPVDKPPSG
jgi:ethanolamine utilization protein EutP (predicted NTPase)